MSPQDMKQRLELAFPTAEIEVNDLTGTQDHYDVYVKHPVFQGLSRIERHQKVMAAFAPELKTGEVHALTIRTQT
jgi:stress-induced morphogen